MDVAIVQPSATSRSAISPDVTTVMMERDKKKKYAGLARREGVDFLAS